MCFNEFLCNGIASRALQQKLPKTFDKHGLQVVVELVDTAPWCVIDCSLECQVRDWNAILPRDISLKNAFRDRVSKDPNVEAGKVPQSFTFMTREGWLILRSVSLFCARNTWPYSDGGEGPKEASPVWQ